MIVFIKDNWTIVLDQIPSFFNDKLYNHFSAAIPSKRYLSGNWDGVYRRYNIRNQSISLTFIREVIKLAKDNDIEAVVYDNRPKPKFPSPSIDQIDKNWLNGITLDDHQVEALHAVCKNDFGMISVPTGGGKSEIAAGIVKMFRCPTVILVDKRILIDQLKSRLELRDVFDNDSKIGLFYGGEMPNGELVVVGSIQSLSSPPLTLKSKNIDSYNTRIANSNKFQDLVKKADLLLVDEADGAASEQYKFLFKNLFKGRRKYGFSGTPYDDKKPVENLFVKDHFGPIIYNVDRMHLQNIGRIMPIKFYAMCVGGKNPNRDAFDIAEKEEIVDNKELHTRIAHIVENFGDEGTLIIVDTCAVEELGKNLEQAIPNSVFIFNKTSAKRRTEVIKDFQNRKIKCLIGSKILKRGTDLNNGCENLISLSTSKLHSNFNQIVGRAVRKNAKGYARVFNFIFMDNYYLFKNSKEQLKAVIGMGYKTIVLNDNEKIDGNEFLKGFRRKTKQ